MMTVPYFKCASRRPETPEAACRHRKRRLLSPSFKYEVHSIRGGYEEIAGYVSDELIRKGYLK